MMIAIGNVEQPACFICCLCQQLSFFLLDHQIDIRNPHNKRHFYFFASSSRSQLQVLLAATKIHQAFWQQKTRKITALAPTNRLDYDLIRIESLLFLCDSGVASAVLAKPRLTTINSQTKHATQLKTIVFPLQQFTHLLTCERQLRTQQPILKCTCSYSGQLIDLDDIGLCMCISGSIVFVGWNSKLDQSDGSGGGGRNWLFAGRFCAMLTSPFSPV